MMLFLSDVRSWILTILVVAVTLKQTAVGFSSSSGGVKAVLFTRGIRTSSCNEPSSSSSSCSSTTRTLSRSTALSMSPAQRLAALLESEMNGTRQSELPILLPCCYDGLTARLIGGSSSFEATFMTGFGVSAVNGYPDTQLVSFAEMQQRCTTIAEALGSVALEHGVDPLPCIAVRSRLLCWCKPSSPSTATH
jgi:hypothetical protein